MLTACQLDAQMPGGSGVPTDVLMSKNGKLGLFTVSNNPAGVLIDVDKDYFSITPEYGNADRAYRRLYDPSNTEYGSVQTTIARVLDASGTFLGHASYTHEPRNNVFGSLRSDPYRGDPFFVSDTFNGNFNYNGPDVGFAYAYALSGDLIFGAEASYKILDGLKDSYTRAHSTGRDFSVGTGLAYAVSEGSIIGISG